LLKKLKKLDLHENELEDKGAMLIAKAIATNTSLEELNMNGNMLHRDSATALTKALAGKGQFKHLLLNENRISADGIQEIKMCLSGLFGDSSVLGPLDDNEESDTENDLGEIDMEQSDIDQLIEKLESVTIDE